MGIGRREFLKLFGATLAALAAATSPAVALLDDFYINRKLGIAFRKFPGWHFNQVLDMGEVKAGQILALEDPELAETLKQETELPLIAISKEPLTTGGKGFTPGITVYIDQSVSNEEGETYDPSTVIQKDILACRALLRQFTVISEPRPVQVSNCRSSNYVASFLFEHTDLVTPTLVRMDTLFIVQDPVWYTLRMYDSPYLGPESTVDYSEFIESIRVL